jgi:L-fucose isomerase-like protein
MNNSTPNPQPAPPAGKKITVGFVGFGEVNTPREIIEKKCQAARVVLAELGVDLAATAPVSDDPAGNDVRRAVRELSGQRFEVLVVCIAGWIPSHAVLKVISEFSHLPMLLWGLAGYYENGRLITTADQAGTTALRKTMEDLGYRFSFVYECPGQPPKREAIGNFLMAVQASCALRRSRVGMMGYRDMNLYSTLHDPILLKRTLGVEIETFEMLEMVQRAEAVAPAEVRLVVERVKRDWVFEIPAEARTLEQSARYFLALQAIIGERGYDAVSLIDVDGMKKLLQLPPAMILMLIANELNLPTTPENDSLGSVTQLIIRGLTAQAAPYFEFYEFLEDRLLVGVPDYIPAAVTDGPIRVRPTRFGGLSEGVLNVSKVKTGRVTLSRLIPWNGSYAIHAVTGTAVDPRPWEEAGWQPPAPQLPSLEIILDTPVEAFADKVAGQHYILSYGDTSPLLRAFCRLNRLVLI